MLPEPFRLAHTAADQAPVHDERGNQGGQPQHKEEHEGVKIHDRASPRTLHGLFRTVDVKTVAASHIRHGAGKAGREALQSLEVIPLPFHKELLLNGGITLLRVIIGSAEALVGLLVVLVILINLMQLLPVVGYNLFGHKQAAVSHRHGGTVHLHVKLVAGKVRRIEDKRVHRSQGIAGRIQGYGHLGILHNLLRRTLRGHLPQGNHQAVVPFHFGGQVFFYRRIRSIVPLEALILPGNFVKSESQVKGILRSLRVQHNRQFVALVDELHQTLVLLLDSFFGATAELDKAGIGFPKLHQEHGERVVQVVLLEYSPNRADD